ncbi:mitochondrial large ribosomal subunit [Xylogone sp. PMI_703]|nr:mitochondrial large ribosomal subunit [Xylogone sp. PMI_703]
MASKVPSRRMVQHGITASRPSPPRFVSCYQQRTLFGWGRRGKEDRDTSLAPQNPLTEEYLKRKPSNNRGGIVRGDLSSSSIFEDEELAGPKPEVPISAGKKIPRNPESMAAALDPDPDARKRWERKMVIKEIQEEGRLTRAQLLKRQERELLSKSHMFKTSVKKLVPLARQIAGKTVEEAIVQMRFSKKKVAKDVREHLEHARNEAIVRRGMGLGVAEGDKFSPTHIQTKDGKRVKVEDPTTLYVDQAWVGRGLYGITPDYRARGQVHRMKNPSTSLSVILKEEATRIRFHDERQKKLENRKVWVQLPNRPVTAQRQYYSW